MSNIDRLASELKSLIQESDDRKPKPYDTDAEVVRVEGDTLWVHIPGGVEETPIKKTINAIKGDKIKVHIANGKAWISGNETAPPTDDRVANIATNIAITADSKADEALSDAGRAKRAADAAENSAVAASDSAESAQESADLAKTTADNAQESADLANKYAFESLRNLSDIEKIVDTVTWIAEHGTYLIVEDLVIDSTKTYYSLVESETISYSLTIDEVLNPHKQYYIKDEEVYIPIKKSEEDPSLISTYYEIHNANWATVDEPVIDDLSKYYRLDINQGVTNYVNSHLALTDEGLNITADNTKYKMVLAAEGMQILNPLGKVVGLHGETIRLGQTTEIHFEATSTGLKFKTADEDICWFGLSSDGIWEMHTSNTFVEDMMRYGDYAFIKRQNGNMSLKWLGE